MKIYDVSAITKKSLNPQPEPFLKTSVMSQFYDAVWEEKKNEVCLPSRGDSASVLYNVSGMLLMNCELIRT